MSAHKKLNQYYATAICGNDILSSVLYVSGIAIFFAGVYAPIVFLLVGFVLYLYKKIYIEVVEALPINGGAYNCLLNGTSKSVAAIAGVMTFLSYVATAVISAKTGMAYLHTIFPWVPIILGTIILLFLFALLVISGLKDSAKVALSIFVLHIVSLFIFLGIGLWFYIHGGHSYFAENYALSQKLIVQHGGFFSMLYLAFSASLLGVSGFESSANFVEEQDQGVFRKTLRNMLIGVVVFNPLVALVVLNSMPLEAIVNAKDFLLSDAASVLAGQFFRTFIVIDAFLVLSGAVLTAYVGVSGLLHRMAIDSCIPLFFAKANKSGSFPRIIITFFLLCSSILLATKGNLLSLAGVYTIAFLCVMSLFAFGNLILKESRNKLKRTYRAPILVVIVAFFATFLGILGNIRIDQANLVFFEMYFIPASAFIFLMLYSDKILKFYLDHSNKNSKLHRYILQKFKSITKDEIVAFVSGVDRLYDILEYIHRNERARKLTLVHCLPPDEGSNKTTFKEIEEALYHMHKAQVFPEFKITLLNVNNKFSPDVVEEIAKRRDVNKNKIFIGSLHHSHKFEYENVGGVRIIFS